MPSVLAVAAVAALITALAVWQGEEPDQPGAVASTSTSTREDPTTSPAAGTSTPAEPTDPEPTDPEPTEAEPTEAETTAAGTTPTEAATAEAVSELGVVVLNQTTRGQLADTVADRLRDAGWRVPFTGNFRGVVPSTTVYYPDGARADALAVAADLPTEPRVRPRFGNLSPTRLTVVVTSSYPA